PESYDLMGRLYLLSKQPVKAIPWYNDYLNTKPKDPFTLYTIAKLHEQSKKATEEWQYLELAMKNGFNYSYILKTDPAWSSFRTNPKWDALIKKFAMKKYPE